ncbi:MAG: hypothetical protein RIT43_2224 [Bacteroidota bacterium]|jgi:hypothetical protein
MRIVLISFFVPFILLSQEGVDYSLSQNWAVLPGKTTEGLEKVKVCTCSDSIDVFYVYPTLFLDDNDPRWIKELDDTVFQKRVLDNAVKYQASAWASAGQLYVPYYRQAHIRSYRNLNEGGTDSLLFAYRDVRSAFMYYLEHYNKGRGIILASHSQGSTHVSLLLKEFFDGKPLQSQLIAAYIPGIGFDKNEFGTVKLMTSPEQIGGFVTWNTHKKKPEKRSVKWHLGKAVINPVTWDTSAFSSRKLHKGFLFRNDKLYTKAVSVHLANGYIWVRPPRFPYRYLAFTMKNYHIGDVNFFWEDIRQNAILRARVYLNQSKGS